MKNGRIAIAYDAEWNGPRGTAAHDPVADIQAPDVVQVVSELLTEMGFPESPVWTSHQVGWMALGGMKSLVDGVVNVSSGFCDRYRYSQTPMLLEILGVPYTGNDPQGMILCRNKHRAKTLARSLGIETPTGLLVDRSTISLVAEMRSSLLPLVVKPNGRSSSIGIHEPARSLAEAASQVDSLHENYPEGIVVEEFIPGPEVTVLLLGSDDDILALPLAVPEDDLSSTGIFDYETKQAASVKWRPAHEVLDEPLVEACIEIAIRFVTAFQLRDFNRVDLRIRDGTTPIMLECNGQPDMSLSSTYIRLVGDYFFDGDDRGVQREYLARSLKRLSLL